MTRIGCWLVVGLGLWLAPGRGLAAPGPGAAVVAARRAVAALDAFWLDRAAGGGVDWRASHAWQRFVIVDTLAGYARMSHAARPRMLIARAVRYRKGLDGNDDDLWAVIAALHVHRLQGGDDLLRWAVARFDAIVTRYWDDTCGGGIWWDHARTYKNAITNELALYAAARLYAGTGQPRFRRWALREWRWFKASGMINGEDLVNDGLNAHCANNGGVTYTYNQGVILGGLLQLSQITGDPGYRRSARSMALASTRALSGPAQILREVTPHLNTDGQIFKGIYVRYLGALVAALPAGAAKHRLSGWLNANAAYVAGHDMDAAGRVPAHWHAAGHRRYSAAAQASAIALFVAAARVSAGSRQGVSSTPASALRAQPRRAVPIRTRR